MSIKTADAKLELEFDAWLGEGPVWDEREKKLFWVDILSGKLMEYDPIQKSNTVYEIGEDLGVAALRKQGGLLLATRSGFHFFDRETGEKSLILNPKENTENFRFNDGKCDPQGRFWAGTLSYDLEEGGGQPLLPSFRSAGRDHAERSDDTQRYGVEQSANEILLYRFSDADNLSV